MITKVINDIDGLPPMGTKPFCNGLVAEGKFLFISGQGPWDPDKKEFTRGNVAEQTRLTLRCLERIIRQVGASHDDVVSVKVYLQALDMYNWKQMNKEFEAFFDGHKPSRTTIGCSLLNIDVEIDAVVLLP